MIKARFIDKLRALGRESINLLNNRIKSGVERREIMRTKILPIDCRQRLHRYRRNRKSQIWQSI